MNEMTPPIGHNSGRVPTPEEIREVLAADHEELSTRRDELVAGFKRSPEKVEDEDTARKMSDFVKQISAAIKKTDALRTDAKEPYLAGGRAVDGFFNPIKEDLTRVKAQLSGRITEYQRRVADEERKRREAAEREARAAAAAAEKAAAEAAAALENDDDLDAAVDAEDAAKAAAAAAEKAATEAAAKAADLSRTRGDFGAVASLRTRWTGEMVDRDTIDLEPLRQHISTDAMNQAVRAFVKAGGRKLKGARIYEETTSVIR